MLTDSTVRDLLKLAEHGDDAAAVELFHQLRDPLKGMVRRQLRQHKHRRTFDSSDICQEVMFDFFRGVARGEFTIRTADDLWKVITFIKRGVTINLIERFHRGCRDVRRTVALGDGTDLRGPDPSPGDVLEQSEFVHTVLDSLAPDERRILSARLDGHKWTELAAEDGTTAGALRMRIKRALRRVSSLESAHLPPPPTKNRSDGVCTTFMRARNLRARTVDRSRRRRELTGAS